MTEATTRTGTGTAPSTRSDEPSVTEQVAAWAKGTPVEEQQARSRAATGYGTTGTTYTETGRSSGTSGTSGTTSYGTGYGTSERGYTAPSYGQSTYGTTETEEPSMYERMKATLSGRSSEEQAAIDRSREQQRETTTYGTRGTEEPSTVETLKAYATGRSPEEQARIDRTRESGREYGRESGYGTTAAGGPSYTGREEPTTGERLKSAFTGRTAEEQAAYDRSRESGREYGRESGYGTTSYTGREEPTTGERLKSAFTGRTAEEQAAYDRSRESERGRARGTEPTTYKPHEEYKREEPSTWQSVKGGIQGRTGTEQMEYERMERERQRIRERQPMGMGAAGHGREQEQPSMWERVEATFTRRTPEEQHRYDEEQRRRREMERSRPGQESGVLETITSYIPGMGHPSTYGTSYGRRGSFGERMKESVEEIRHSVREAFDFGGGERRGTRGYTGTETREPRGHYSSRYTGTETRERPYTSSTEYGRGTSAEYGHGRGTTQATRTTAY